MRSLSCHRLPLVTPRGRGAPGAGTRACSWPASALSLAAALLLLVPGGALAQAGRVQGNGDVERLHALVDELREIRIPTHAPEEYREAARRYGDLLTRLERVDSAALPFADQVDFGLFRAHVRTELFEIDSIRHHTVNPVGYYALGSTNRLFLWPQGQEPQPGDYRAAIEEMRRLPAVLENARRNLERPARTWTENAIYQGMYALLLLEEYVPTLDPGDPALQRDLRTAAREAVPAVQAYRAWLRDELLPRSDRSPAWRPEEVEFYQFVHEYLDGYSVERMIQVAEEEDRDIMAAMEALADSIHPSGDLRTVWEEMKDEAPPFDQVLPMAQRYVDMATEWLEGRGAHVVAIPDFDYGARMTPPMGRRVLSFGGASGGPTIDGRPSGYYVITPLEEGLTEEERRQRLRSYNPYWTHVISYHEWLGHNVEGANTAIHVDRPMRRRFGSIYMSQAWSFYLEKLLEDEGYYQDELEYTSQLKTRMARLQMRMWRVQRILTKLKMATGEMTFEESVRAYIDRIGMEPANALIEVQRDSQSPSPPGREIIGERVILEMRDEYFRRMGGAGSLRDFHDRLLRYGRLPLPVIRELMMLELERGIAEP